MTAKQLVKLLMVDDNKADFVFLRELVNLKPKEGEALSNTDDQEYKVTWAEDIEQAKTLLKDEDFDVVLVDYYMPDTEGFDGVRLLVKTNPLIPTIILTGAESDDLEEKALENGAQDYLVKPKLSRQGLVRTIRHAIARLRAIQDGVPAGDYDSSHLKNLAALREIRASIQAMKAL